MQTSAATVLDSYLAALRAGNRRRAIAIVDEARAAGLDLRTLYLGVFQPALREIGRLWQENEITVAEEHLATAVTQMAMARLYDELCADAPDNGRLLVAACAETERHEVGLRMVCDFLELECWETIYLGSSVPPESLLALVRARRPDVVALSASTLPHLSQLRATVDAIRALDHGGTEPYIVMGGRPFLDDPALATRLGADATAQDAADAVALLRGRFG